jgi:hypothetical protein
MGPAPVVIGNISFSSSRVLGAALLVATIVLLISAVSRAAPSGLSVSQ